MCILVYKRMFNEEWRTLVYFGVNLHLYLTQKANVTVIVDLNIHELHIYVHISVCKLYVQSKNGALSCILDKLTLVFDTKSKC